MHDIYFYGKRDFAEFIKVKLLKSGGDQKMWSQVSL
jgi:hypothetical protein